MAVIKMKPTSPGQRAVVKITRDHLHKGEPYAPLLEPQFQKAGRNNNGHITTRHKGGGHKHHYRVVDFVRNKDGIPAKVERIEYDPNRTAHIALVVLRRRRAPLHHRPARPGSRRAAAVRFGSPDPRRQHPADPQHPGGLDHPLHRAAARQGRADRAFGRHLRDAAGARRHLRPGPHALRRSAPRSTSSAAPPSAKSPTKSTACASSARPASSATWASARRCAAS